MEGHSFDIKLSSHLNAGSMKSTDAHLTVLLGLLNEEGHIKALCSVLISEKQ